MKTKKFLFKSLLAAFCLGLTPKVSAQVASTYGFHQEFGTYTPITGGTVNSAIIGDDEGGSVTIPFTFRFNGNNYTSLYANTNGAIHFGSTNNSVTSFGTAYNLIGVFNRDLNGISANGAEFRSQFVINGTDSTFILQYSNWSIYGNADTRLNFQVHLKPSGVIKLVYGVMTAPATYTTTVTPYIGLRSTLANDFNLRTNNTDLNIPYNNNVNTSKESYTSQTMYMNFAANSPLGIPQVGLTFVYTPTTCSPPNTFVISNILESAFTINTTTPSTNSYYYEVRTYGGPLSGSNGLVTSGTGVFPLQISTNLNPITHYVVYARKICSTDSESTFNSIGVQTSCNALSIPLFEGFNSNIIPTCWEKQHVGPTSNTSYVSFVTTTTTPTVSPQEGTYFVRFNSNASASSGLSERLNTKRIDATGMQDLLVDFNFYQNNTNNNQERVELVYSIDNGSTWRTAGSVNRYNATNGWKRQLMPLPAETNNASSLKVGVVFHSFGGQNMALDSFQIRTSPAPTISNVLVGNICATALQPSTITIQGKYLQQAVVTINGIVQPIISQSLTEIVFSAAPGNDGFIVVTSPHGTATSLTEVQLIDNPIITTDVEAVISCLGEGKEVHITSELSNYDSYTITFNGTVTGDETVGYTLASTTSQIAHITGTRVVNNTNCNIVHAITYTATTTPNIYPSPIAASYCEGEVVTLNYHTAYESNVAAGPYSGTTLTFNPFYSGWGGFKSQSIYRAEELLAMGLTPGTAIESLGINYLTTSSATHVGFRIRIANVPNTVAPTTFLLDSDANFYTVYQANITPSVNGIQTFTLATPYIWDGVSSIMIETVQSNGLTSQSGATSVQGENPGFTSYAYRYMDNTPIATAYTTTATSGTQNDRIKWRFGFSSPIFATEPQTTVSWTAPGDLYLDNALENVVSNELTNNVYYRVTDLSQGVGVTVTNAPGCSATYTFNVNANPTIREQVDIETCNYYVYKGQYFTETGTYTDSLSSAITGCDSIYTIHLTVGNNIHTYPSISVCGSYDFNGQTLSTSGIYTTVFQTATGCDSTVTLNLTIQNELNAFVSLQGDDLVAYSTIPGETFQWQNCQTGEMIAGATSNTFTPTEPGIYRVHITSGSCTGSSICAAYGNVGIDLATDESLTVYPNPTKSAVTISYDSNESMNVSVIDAMGRIVNRMIINTGETIDLSSFEPGVYLLNLSNPTSSKVVRVVKQ